MVQEIHASLVNVDTMFQQILFYRHRNLCARKLEFKVILPMGSVNITESIFTSLICMLVHCNQSHVIKRNLKM